MAGAWVEERAETEPRLLSGVDAYRSVAFRGCRCFGGIIMSESYRRVDGSKAFVKVFSKRRRAGVGK